VYFADAGEGKALGELLPLKTKMEKFKKTEIIILAMLWSMSLTSYSIALLNNNVLFTSDYLGLAGLTLVTMIALIKPERSFQSVLMLLFSGLFNLLSFAYYFNVVITFGFSVLVTPGIQLISLVLLIVLIINKKNEAGKFYRETFGLTEDKRENERKNAQNSFKTKFEQLSDIEIDIKLQQDLVPEAIAALNEIKAERKNAQHYQLADGG
jgi:hypothetical protein